MSADYFTDYAENALAEWVRGQGRPAYPATNWYLAPGSAGSDSGITEITGVGLGRVAASRALATFAGTQAAGSILASSGTSKTTSNNADVNFGAPTGSGTLTHVGFMDASSGGNCWMWIPVTAISFTTGSPAAVKVLAQQMVITLGVGGGMSNYFVNSLIDDIFRGQAFAFPSPIYPSYYTAAPTDAGGGTEASGGGYARASLTPSRTNISGTQAAGSTSASSGSGGQVSNNIAVAHPAPSGSQGTIVATGVHDASSSGNLLWWAAVAAPFSVASGGPAPTYAPGALSLTIA